MDESQLLNKFNFNELGDKLLQEIKIKHLKIDNYQKDVFLSFNILNSFKNLNKSLSGLHHTSYFDTQYKDKKILQ
jgi:hypothetical protein